MVFGFAFCQTILPVAESMAKRVLSLPYTHTRVAGPCGVFSEATSGAVIVERTYSFGAVEIWAVHFTSNRETLSRLRIFSSGFEPVRSGSWPQVNHSFCAVASPGTRKNINLNAKPTALTDRIEMVRRPAIICPRDFPCRVPQQISILPREQCQALFDYGTQRVTWPKPASSSDQAFSLWLQGPAAEPLRAGPRWPKLARSPQPVVNCSLG